MTPVIDIVFQLIIFFSVVSKFIEAENFPVAVPDGCHFAQSVPDYQAQVTTVTVMNSAKGGADFAVGSQKIDSASYADIVDKLAGLIDIQLKNLPVGNRVVTLRIDKDVCFAQAQYALAGIAASSATNIQLAVLKDGHSGSE